jgi:hypothetical protein
MCVERTNERNVPLRGSGSTRTNAMSLCKQTGNHHQYDQERDPMNGCHRAALGIMAR